MTRRRSRKKDEISTFLRKMSRYLGVFLLVAFLAAMPVSATEYVIDHNDNNAQLNRLQNGSQYATDYYDDRDLPELSAAAVALRNNNRAIENLRNDLDFLDDLPSKCRGLLDDRLWNSIGRNQYDVRSGQLSDLEDLYLYDRDCWDYFGKHGLPYVGDFSNSRYGYGQDYGQQGYYMGQGRRDMYTPHYDTFRNSRFWTQESNSKFGYSGYSSSKHGYGPGDHYGGGSWSTHGGYYDMRHPSGIRGYYGAYPGAYAGGYGNSRYGPGYNMGYGYGHNNGRYGRYGNSRYGYARKYPFRQQVYNNPRHYRGDFAGAVKDDKIYQSWERRCVNKAIDNHGMLSEWCTRSRDLWDDGSSAVF